MAEPKTTRIELRAHARSADRIRYAAELTHQSVSSFMLSAAEERAEQVIAMTASSIVPSAFFDEIYEALDAPPRPNDALARIARRKRRVTQR